ncbi:MAG TPA: DNA-directed RNA polymerase subunit H [archaeon]|nr:DNA-directed RNA polymerase subunit H [archaeon]
MKKIEIIKHEFVPKHILLKEEEREEVLKNYGITLRQLPRILETDPAIKEMNPTPGDVVKIVRRSQTSGESIYYRVVIKATTSA